MPRDIPVGNGLLLVNFDDGYQPRDLYWPHVGQENHTAGHECRFGVWVDGTFSWVSDDGWARTLVYEHDTLLIGLWYLSAEPSKAGMFAVDDPRITATMRAVRDRLWVKTDVGGVARYENNNYHQVSREIDTVPSNPWFVCTLWVAQWLTTAARTLDDLQSARKLLDWATTHALPSGVMAEQIHPYTNAPLSASPLTWSHATLVSAVHEYTVRWARLSAPEAEALDAHL